MIAYIKGTVEEILEDRVILEAEIWDIISLCLWEQWNTSSTKGRR